MSEPTHACICMQTDLSPAPVGQASSFPPGPPCSCPHQALQWCSVIAPLIDSLTLDKSLKILCQLICQREKHVRALCESGTHEALDECGD